MSCPLPNSYRRFGGSFYLDFQISSVLVNLYHEDECTKFFQNVTNCLMTNAQFVIPEELELRYIIVERERERERELVQKTHSVCIENH